MSVVRNSQWKFHSNQYKVPMEICREKFHESFSECFNHGTSKEQNVWQVKRYLLIYSSE